MSESGVNGAAVAITGGTGSFGTTMAAHLLRRGVGAVHILSRDEAKQDAMRIRFSDTRLRFFPSDVRDPDSVANAFAGADHVFHAAALKHVPSCEFFPQQAVKTVRCSDTVFLNEGLLARVASALPETKTALYVADYPEDCMIPDTPVAEAIHMSATTSAVLAQLGTHRSPSFTDLKVTREVP